MSTESPTLNPASSTPPAATPEPPKVSRGEIWRHRIWIAITVIFFIELGMILVVIPWTFLWNDNKLLILHPAWRAIVMHGFTRGVVTGLGLVNVWIGIWEAVHYTEKA